MISGVRPLTCDTFSDANAIRSLAASRSNRLQHPLEADSGVDSASCAAVTSSPSLCGMVWRWKRIVPSLVTVRGRKLKRRSVQPFDWFLRDLAMGLGQADRIVDDRTGRADSLARSNHVSADERARLGGERDSGFAVEYGRRFCLRSSRLGGHS